MLAWWSALDTLMRRVVAISLIVFVLAAILLTLSFCRRGEEARRARAGETMAEGRTASAIEAINEIGELGDRSHATDAQVKEAQDAIRQADPADRDRVARHRLCVLQQRPDCARLLRAGPPDPGAGYAPR